MDLKTYQSLTGRTNADLGSKAINASHMMLGIVGEWGEAEREFYTIDMNSTDNEVGLAVDEQIDAVWYCSELANLYNIQLHPISHSGDITESITRLAEGIKKYLAYNKELQTSFVEDSLNYIVGFCKFRVKQLGYSFETGLDRNIAKLQKRFPEKFSAELAIAKGDEQ
jgi:hypothetical protein